LLDRFDYYTFTLLHYPMDTTLAERGVYSLGGAPKRVVKLRDLGNLRHWWSTFSHSVVFEVESLPLTWLSRSEEGPFSGKESDCEEALLSHVSPVSLGEFVWPNSAPKRLTSAFWARFCIDTHCTS